ncbi:hypothetical protein [Thermus phage P23-45]|uniref:Uncharacterized protein n=1 Tax=Thermus virus P23-45 TaxID=2914006 RepID=A7XX39_BP234|nr:hypothetical protein P23p18 [Thermus phage P23-45]ABU96851.1 hypothetical protein P23p18 [Thermus phage P23-45]UYB98456.1 hypothetical protein [Thermus phage P23-45]
MRKWYLLVITNPEGIESILKISDNKEEVLTAAKALLAAVRPFFPVVEGPDDSLDEMESVSQLDAALEELGFDGDFVSLPVAFFYEGENVVRVFALYKLHIRVLAQKGGFVRWSREESESLHDELVNFATSLGDDWFV